jgi:hypothetical protein
MSPKGRAVAGALIVVALTVSGLIAGAASAGIRLKRDGRSCGSVAVERNMTYDLEVIKGSPSCSTVRRIAKRYGHPISKKPKYDCGTKAYECEYSVYPEGWRCGGLFQGNFQCWHGSDSPARAPEAFDATPGLASRSARAVP